MPRPPALLRLDADRDTPDALDARVRARGMPPAVEREALDAIQRIRRARAGDADAGVAHAALDWLLTLPWHERSTPVPSLAHVRAALDASHVALDEAKARLLDSAAASARADAPAPTLCFVGPAGVGKSSLARSFARALGRPFVRVPLGGVRDAAELRGDRRSAPGASPGRLMWAMRRAAVVDPVVLLDNVDRLAADARGAPAAALVDALDPEQRHAFVDAFLDVEYDLSRVSFVVTSATLSGVPDAVREHVDVVRLTGYADDEKVEIAARHLVPRRLAGYGLTAGAVSWESGALEAIVRGWAREPGVRELERQVARAVSAVVQGPADGGTFVRVADLPSLLGPPRFRDGPPAYDRVGVANGLAYTSAGGELIEVEVSALPGRGRVQLTGALGDVMKESASAAIGFVRARAERLGVDPAFHRTRDVHIHLPAAATPKDGPSAGVTIATALVSALTGVPVRGDVAMTGEITLHGRVLYVGGVREKAIAARRHEVAHVVLPRASASALDALPAALRAGRAWHLVDTADEVLALALRPGDGAAARRPAGRRPGVLVAASATEVR